MKKLLLALSCIALPALGFAQSKEATEPAMKQFMQYYNQQQVDNIRALCGEDWGEARERMWTAQALDEMHRKYGKIEQVKYLGTDEGVEIFLSLFETGPRATGITVDTKGKLGTFRFITSSPTIDKMVAEAKL